MKESNTNVKSESKMEKGPSPKNSSVIPKTKSVETDKNKGKSDERNSVRQNVKQERRSFL